MTENPFCIFVVDDDTLLRLVIVDQLQGHNYRIHEFANGADCLAALDLQPNLILLDIEMPGVSGIEVCRQIRAEGNDEVQVMFVSAHDDLEILLTAFDAGGNDFIPKNAKKEVLLRKVELAIETEQQKRNLRSQLDYARQTAFTAMSSLGETGAILHFLRTSFQCRTPEQLGRLIIETLPQYGANGLVKLADASGEHDFGPEPVCSPLERSILTYVMKLGRIYQAGDRLVLNFPYVTLLVTGLDVNDPDAIGRLRDHLAILVEGASARMEAMVSEQQRRLQAKVRLESIRELNALLGEIEQNQQANHVQLVNLSEQHRSNMENAFVHLGLTDSQEFLLHGYVDELTTQLDQLFDKDNQLALRLHQILEKQNALLAGGEDGGAA
ncbi:response regulator receiver protein [Methylomonas koyamae]|uniref:Response regulator receiver protein n=1 Tax=Methylomonas koyamae TaxID=702114 RepID=A0A177NK51_9GAMM|nr:response regulator [Methylomonas koyamae]OAI18377.1 response regulator receiver protein [Methylomonas koyamae]